jgi:carbon-monoxide dehydrogenase medium subunit
MKPPELDYVAPESLDAAVALLRDDPAAKVLAGGQSLVPLLNLRLAAPSVLIDLRRVPGLAEVRRSDGHVAIGAMVRQRVAERDETLHAAAPLVRAALRHVAHPQIRSQGTVGGSVAHADPAAELPAVVLALDGRVRARGPDGERVIAAGDFFTGFLSTALADDEVVTAVELPVSGPRTGAACVEIARRAGDYALCGAAAQVTLAADGSVTAVGVGLFGIGDRVVRARAVEESLEGRRPAPETLRAVAGEASEGLRPRQDRNVPPDYRLHLARVVTRRALDEAVRRSSE